MFVDSVTAKRESRQKAKIHNPPSYSRFVEPDPIGYEDSPNLYVYVLNDPINLTDPLGLEVLCGGQWADVCGQRPEPDSWWGGSVFAKELVDFDLAQHILDTIVVTAKRLPRRRTGDVRDLLKRPWQPSQCSSGPVIFGGPFVEGYLIFGGGVSGGGYYDTGTGGYGLFGSGEGTAVGGSGSFGFGGSVGGVIGLANDLTSFSGKYSTIGIGFRGVGINYSFNQGNILSPISISAGPAVSGLPGTAIPVSFHYSQGKTDLIPLWSGGC